MAFDYSDIAATAAEILAEFGDDATLTRVTSPGTYNPATGTTTPTNSTATVKAVVFPYADKHIDGTLIQSGDQQAFIEAVGTEPKPGDKFTWGTTVFQIVRTKNISPARVAVLFEAQLRR